MAEWGFSLGTAATGYLYVAENWNTSTQVSLHVRLRFYKTGGSFNNAGDANWNGNVGGVTGSGNFNWGSSNPLNLTLWEFDYTYNKDANGNINVSCYGYIDGRNNPYANAGSTSQTYTPARIGIAPTLATPTADTIKPTSFRLGGNATSNGLGTSTTLTMYYRLQGGGSWINAGAKTDVAGVSYWTITGLKPGKTYEYYYSGANNNGDTANSTTYTVKTKGIAGHAPLMMRLA
jgi:hypothetical protein